MEPGLDTLKVQTVLNRAGRNVSEAGFVNSPVYRGSTVIHTAFDQVLDGKKLPFSHQYGSFGTPTFSELERAWNTMTGAAGTVLLPSGLAAGILVLMVTAKTGDTIFVCDTVYLPVRNYCAGYLKKMNVTTVYYKSTISPDDMRELFKQHPQTTVLYFESPGSQTFEVQDIPALSAVAKEFDATTIVDNTWATPIFFDALRKGCDISVEAGTKYLSGHSDLLLGLVAANEKWFPAIRETFELVGSLAGSEDCFLALRGLRTMYIRVKEAERRGLEFARWVREQKCVLKVLHPAFETCPGHEAWKRDFTGSTGVFSFILQPEYTLEDVVRMLDNMKVFCMGYSWGGFESLIMHYDCTPFRTAEKFNPGGRLIRLTIGLEDVEDLRADLLEGFQRLDKK
ncbi:cystathionine beta-lyase [Strigomonas culicis]|uniref:Cystathionine beta-lyase n=1 Tax=Strigomonas culicis TaxID=28005 RepID=S9VRI9_9TRYP|nr:cystathionine beta-lyase [Strigomonas culicis]|eukprot:EPY29671.1 cystathionine beta-lyase [Strigomonas culicis]